MSTCLLLAVFAACATEETTATATEASAPVSGRQHLATAIPTGHVDTSVLLLERDLPEEIVAGQEFWYELKVTNVGHTPVQDVVLRDECASNWSMVKAEPAPAARSSPFVWALGELKPGEYRSVRVTGATKETVMFTSCASATYNTAVCLTAPVVKPALNISIKAPSEVTPCDAIDLRVTVTNTGTAALSDVRVDYPLPEGWSTVDGKTVAKFSLDSLAPEQSREFKVTAKAPRTGDYTLRANGTAAPGLKIDATPVAISVRQSLLGIEANAPSEVYSGRPATFTFRVTNNGNGTATAATVESRVPADARFLSANEGGTFQDGVVTWKLPSIPVKTTRALTMTLEAGPVGMMETKATASAYCASAVEAGTRVKVQGIPALLLEVTDLTDPVEVGEETVYQIVVTNQGSTAATNVKLTGALENTQQYVSATGAKATARGGAVTFETIPSIKPKSSATLRLTVKCVEAGDTRFRLTMTADQITRPVEETESTHIYR